LKTYIKEALFILVILFCNRNAQAQDSTKVKFDTDKLEFGMYLGGDFSGNNLLFSFLPYASYDLHPKISFGVCPNVLVIVNAQFQYPQGMYGTSVFGRFYISEHFFLQAENAVLNRKFTNSTSVSKQRRWVDEIMLGGGYRKDMSFGYAYFTGFYIANYKNYKSPYPRPIIIRAGVGLRLNSELLR